MDTPRYKHDCNSCRYLGRFDPDAPCADGTTLPMKFDLYYCGKSVLGGSCIARHADEGWEYASSPADIMPTFIEDVTARGHHSTYSEALIECYHRVRMGGWSRHR